MDRANTAEVFDLQRERQHRIRQATGGGGPPQDTGRNWLAEMGQGTRFIARRKAGMETECDDFIVSEKFGDVTLLGRSIKGRDFVFEWHDTELFSKQWKFYLSIEIVGQENGNDKHLQPRGLGEHEEPQGEHLVLEDRSDSE